MRPWLLVLLLLSAVPAHAQLRGHGGPVRALAISADGNTAVSGSFDTSAILWSLKIDVAKQVLRFHDGAVNAVAFLGPGADSVATSGAELVLAIWNASETQPPEVLPGHGCPVVSLAV